MTTTFTSTFRKWGAWPEQRLMTHRSVSGAMHRVTNIGLQTLEQWATGFGVLSLPLRYFPRFCFPWTYVYVYEGRWVLLALARERAMRMLSATWSVQLSVTEKRLVTFISPFRWLVRSSGGGWTLHRELLCFKNAQHDNYQLRPLRSFLNLYLIAFTMTDVAKFW